MVKKISEHPIIIILGIIATVFTILGTSLTDLISRSTDGHAEPSTLDTEAASDTAITENSTTTNQETSNYDEFSNAVDITPQNYEEILFLYAEPIDESANESNMYLSASFCHLPNIQTADYVVGGTWLVQGMEKDANTFVGNVKLWNEIHPDEKYCGEIKYGTVWAENSNGTSSEEPESFNLPQCSYGTFQIQLTDIDPTGIYCCELNIQINGSEYTKILSFKFE